MNKAYRYAIASIAVLLPSTAMAQAGPSPSATASATAEVVQPIAITCSGMNFGRLSPLASPTSVTLPPQGTPLIDASNIVVPGSRNLATPSNCGVTGALNLAYTVTLPTSATLTSGANTMSLSNFTISEELDGMPLDRLLATPQGSGGFDGFGVGAQLAVGGNQAPGLYTGTFVVSVRYN